jgi:hypothetical protein
LTRVVFLSACIRSIDQFGRLLAHVRF